MNRKVPVDPAKPAGSSATNAPGRTQDRGDRRRDVYWDHRMTGAGRSATTAGGNRSVMPFSRGQKFIVARGGKFLEYVRMHQKLTSVTGVSLCSGVVSSAWNRLRLFHDADSISGPMSEDPRIEVDSIDVLKEIEDVAKSFVAPATSGFFVQWLAGDRLHLLLFNLSTTQAASLLYWLSVMELD